MLGRSIGLTCWLVTWMLLAACETAASPGAACVRASDCPAPLACSFGRCRSACSADRDCGAGRSCLLDADALGTCSLDADLGCESGVGRDCPAGLVCVGDRCAQSCSATMGCATGSVCATASGVSFCASTTAADAGTDDSGTLGSPCDRLVDLTSPDAGALPLVYRTNTDDAPLESVLPIVTCTTDATRIAHTIGIRYRMRHDARLRVDTHRPYTTASFDTVAGIFDGCGPAVTELGCNDDDTDDATLPHARIFTETAIPAGQEVVIGVGGFDPPGGGHVSSGLLEVTIQEAVLVDPGAACDTSGQTTHCIGSGCATIQTGQGVCMVEIPEVEPNARAMAQPVDPSSPMVVSGHFPTGDQDCFAFPIPAGGSLVATITDGNGECPNPYTPIDLVLRDAGGTIVAEVDGSAVTGAPHCPALDGTTSGTAHALAGGTYTLCVEVAASGELLFYDLAMHVLP